MDFPERPGYYVLTMQGLSELWETVTICMMTRTGSGSVEECGHVRLLGLFQAENVREFCPCIAELLCLQLYHKISQSSLFYHSNKELLPRGKTGRTWLLVLQEKAYFLRKPFSCSA